MRAISYSKKDSKKESLNGICFLRVLVILSLLATGGILGAFAFQYLKSYETSSFESNYYSATDLLVESIQNRFDRNAIATTQVSKLVGASFNDDRWPNVTLSSFEAVCSAQILAAEVRSFSLNPLVTAMNFKSWEHYATTHVNLLGGDNALLESVNGSWPVSNGMFTVDSSGRPLAVQNNGTKTLHFPVWQIAPILEGEGAVMFDDYSALDGRLLIDYVIATKRCGLTDVYQLVEDRYVRPSALLFCGIYPNQTLQGLLTAAFSWDTVIDQSLPDYLQSVDVILKTSTTSFTYTVTAGRVTLRGAGDLHDPAFDRYRQKATAAIAESNASANRASVKYTFEIYPTSTLSDQYFSEVPVVFTVSMVLFFFLMALVFLGYDYLVRVRTEALIRHAEVSSKYLNQFFPAFVRKRLLQPPASIPEPASARRFHWQVTASTPNKGSSRRKPVGVAVGPPPTQYDDPIAEVFDDSTVLFADISGFTRWSSSHSATDVFSLLERLFLEFDRIAMERGVYKMCTIGDWYVQYIVLKVGYIISSDFYTSFSAMWRLQVCRIPLQSMLLSWLISLWIYCTAVRAYWVRKRVSGSGLDFIVVPSSGDSFVERRVHLSYLERLT